MRHDTFTHPPERTDAERQAANEEREAWRHLAEGDRISAAAMAAAAAMTHARGAGLDAPPPVVRLDLKGTAYHAAICARIARELRSEPERTARVLTLAPPGWSIDYPPHESRGVRYGTSTLSGYGDDWTAHVHELAADAVIFDKRAIPSHAELATLVISGPMSDPSLPGGMRDSLSAGLVPWRDVPQPDRDPRFGDARSFDRVGLDAYRTIAERFGVQTYTLAALLGDRPDFQTPDEARERMAAAAA